MHKRSISGKTSEKSIRKYLFMHLNVHLDALIRKNIRHEGLILVEWINGKTIREAAESKGVPEGTVSGYYRNFNRNPERYHRRAKEVSERRGSILNSPAQLSRATEGQILLRVYYSLIGKGKYHQAKAFLEAEQLREKYIQSRMSGVSSFAWYCMDPEKNMYLVPIVVEELTTEMKNLKFEEKLTQLDQLENSGEEKDKKSVAKLADALRQKLDLPPRQG